MGYDWEFDGSVDFAPPKYRAEKYLECENIGKKMLEQQSEENALLFLDKFHYVSYLADNHLNEIKNWQQLVGFEEMALSLLQSDDATFKWIVYPQQASMWRIEFDKLRETEKEVGKSISPSEFKELIYQFNTKYKKLNEQNKKYKHGKHTLYWIQSGLVKNKIRDLLDFKDLDKNEKISYLEMYGAVDYKVDYRG